MLTDNSAVFVTIKKDGAVRGCIGTVTPTTGCLAHEIITNTINKADSKLNDDASIK